MGNQGSIGYLIIQLLCQGYARITAPHKLSFVLSYGLNY